MICLLARTDLLTELRELRGDEEMRKERQQRE